jgi:hypothetical protein
MKSLLVLLPLLVLHSTSAAAAEPPRPLPANGAVVFKNGLAFVTREGTLPFQAGEARLTPAPSALLGTLWITAAGRPVDEIRAASQTRETQQITTTIAALLDGNPGRAVTIRVGDREYTGTLLKTPTPIRVPAADESETSRIVPVESALLLIDVGGKVHAFERGAVQSVAFVQPPSTTRGVTITESTLTIRGKGLTGDVPVSLGYLRSGISWMPEVSITLLDDARARVTLQATLINDGEPLDDASIRFAVGYPNFAFSHIPSPMSLQLTLNELLARLGGSGASNAGRFANVATQQVMLNSAGFIGDDGPVDVDAVTAGESAGDLFFYEQNNVTLGVGERAVHPLLTQTVPYRHIYLWRVPAETDETRNATGVARADQVWHSISLTNTGSTPWTTAPALVLSNGRPLAQDTLPYTAAGSTGDVKLTIATDISVERDELEVDRKPRDLTRAGYTYDAVTIEGTLTLRNYKREPVTLSIDKTIEGTTLTRTPEAKQTRTAVRPRAINPTERLQWEIPLAPGERKEVKYRYKVWVRE